jgi:hypothetical protein
MADETPSLPRKPCPVRHEFDLSAAPAFTRMPRSERGGWCLFGRLLIWAMRNNFKGESDR